MSETKDTGGPAFPMTDRAAGGNGMTLRDWFAGQALAAVISCRVPDDDAFCITEEAYSIADAMLKERGKGEAA